MATITDTQGVGRVALALVAAAALAGCVFVPPEPDPEPTLAAPAPEPVLAEPAVPVPPPRPVRRPPPARDIALVLDASSAAHAALAAELEALLTRDGHRVTTVDAGEPEALDAFAGNARTIAVAVGPSAARIARAATRAPLVFCQVFNHHEVLEADAPSWGVAALPPARLQLRAMKALDPKLARIGVIVGEPHIDLAEAAVAAAPELGMAVSYEIAASDRETEYLFKRLALQVDGMWLPPDNRILSPGVLRELLDYARGHGVRVLVGNDALLDWGALASATGTPSDVAQTVRRIVGRLTNGGGAELPVLTPLSEVELNVNAQVAADLGLATPERLPWVLREPD